MYRRIYVFGAVWLLACMATAALAQGAALPSSAIADGLTQLAASFPGTSALMLIAVASFGASLVCAVTPTPAPGSRWRGAYELLECVALLTRTAKLTGIPAIDALHTAGAALLEVRAPAGPPTRPLPAPPGGDASRSPAENGK